MDNAICTFSNAVRHASKDLLILLLMHSVHSVKHSFTLVLHSVKYIGITFYSGEEGPVRV